MGSHKGARKADYAGDDFKLPDANLNSNDISSRVTDLLDCCNKTASMKSNTSFVLPDRLAP